MEDAKAFVRRVRDEFSDATHNCWAYVVGPPGTSRDNGSSDDGEPGGTAGRPMLSVLLNSGIGDGFVRQATGSQFATVVVQEFPFAIDGRHT